MGFLFTLPSPNPTDYADTLDFRDHVTAHFQSNCYSPEASPDCNCHTTTFDSYGFFYQGIGYPRPPTAPTDYEHQLSRYGTIAIGHSICTCRPGYEGYEQGHNSI